MNPDRAALIRSIQKDMERARTLNLPAVEYLLETALAEVLGPEREQVREAARKHLPETRGH